MNASDLEADLGRVWSLPAPGPAARDLRDSVDARYAPSVRELDPDGIHVVGLGDAGRSAIHQLRFDDFDRLTQHVPMHVLELTNPGSDGRRDGWHMAEVGRSVARKTGADVVTVTKRSPFIVLVAALDEPRSAGAACVIAQALRRSGDATVVVVCVEPPADEPTAALALRCLAEQADTVITVASTGTEPCSIALARNVGLVLGPAEHGTIGVDLDEVRMVYAQGGRRACTGWGRATGRHAGRAAARQAFGSLARLSWRTRAIFGRIVGGPELRGWFREVKDVFDELSLAAVDVDLVWSASLDLSLGADVSVGIVLLGVDDFPRRR